MISKTINSFKNAFRGIRTTWQEELNFRIELAVTLVVLVLMIMFRFSFGESALCIVAIVLVLSAEIVNTVVEDLCNKVEPAYDSAIGKIKDTMAGLVFVSSLGAFVLGILVFWHHFL
ncbi:MAG: diacylglycerol kinase [bacterium]